MISSQFVRYVIVGCANTAASYLVYALLLWLGLVFQWANLGATVAGIVIGFFTQSRFVFANQDLRRFAPFAMLWVVMYLCSITLIWMFKQAGLGDYLAGLLALPPIVLLSFVLQKFLVFR